MALENQASSDRAGYRIPVQITESGHVDLARMRWFTASEVGAAISLKSIWRTPDRRRLWLWPQAALREVFKRPTRRVSNSSKSPTTVLEASMRVPRCLLSLWMRDAVLGMSPTTLHAKCPLPPTLPKHDRVLHPPHKGRNRN